MDLNDHVTQFQFLVCDRASQFTASFDAVLADVGIRMVRAELTARWSSVGGTCV